MVYDWSVWHDDLFEYDPAQIELVDRIRLASAAHAHYGFRPVQLQILPPGASDAYPNFVGLWVQDDDAAYQYHASMFHVDLGDLEFAQGEQVVEDLELFCDQINAIARPEEIHPSIGDGWRPISITGLRYAHFALIGPTVTFTEFAVAWVRDGRAWKVDRCGPTFAELAAALAHARDSGWRPTSLLWTEEGFAFALVEEESQPDWIVRGSIDDFYEDDYPSGYRPVAMIPEAIVAIRQTDASDWLTFDTNVGTLHDVMSDLYALRLRLSCFTYDLEKGAIRIAALHSKRGDSNGDIHVTSGESDALDFAGDAAIDAWIREQVVQRQIGSAVLAISRDGEIVVERSYSFRCDGASPTAPSVPMRVASVSKSITAVGVLRLLEEHPQYTITTPVFAIPGMPAPIGYPDAVLDVTIRDLLQHTCGWTNGPLGFSMEEIQADLGYIPLAFMEAPRATLVRYALNADGAVQSPAIQFGFAAADVGGSFVKYSNFGFMLLAQLIEAVSGKSYENYIREKFLAPLEMESTFIGETARFHVDSNEPAYEGGPAYFGEKVPGDAFKFDTPRFGFWHDTPSTVIPAAYGGNFVLAQVDGNGGWVSTATDILRFLRAFDGYEEGAGMVANGSVLLTPESMNLMWGIANRIPSDEVQATYGLGWYVRGSISGGYAFFHPGNSPGTFALMMHRGRSNAIFICSRDSFLYPDVAKMLDEGLQDSAPAQE